MLRVDPPTVVPIRSRHLLERPTPPRNGGSERVRHEHATGPVRARGGDRTAPAAGAAPTDGRVTPCPLAPASPGSSSSRAPGAAWGLSPEELGRGRGVTRCRRRRDRQAAGVWERRRRAPPDQLGGADQSGWERARLDRAGIPEQKGPVDRAGPDQPRDTGHAPPWCGRPPRHPARGAPDRSQPPRRRPLRGADRRHPPDHAPSGRRRKRPATPRVDALKRYRSALLGPGPNCSAALRHEHPAIHRQHMPCNETRRRRNQKRHRPRHILRRAEPA